MPFGVSFLPAYFQAFGLAEGFSFPLFGKKKKRRFSSFSRSYLYPSIFLTGRMGSAFTPPKYLQASLKIWL